jgi:hypothetical protein
MASGEVSGNGPAAGMHSPLAQSEKTFRSGWAYHPDGICRTAGDVTRTSGGAGRGEAARSLPISIMRKEDHGRS